MCGAIYRGGNLQGHYSPLNLLDELAGGAERMSADAGSARLPLHGLQKSNHKSLPIRSFYRRDLKDHKAGDACFLRFFALHAFFAV